MIAIHNTNSGFHPHWINYCIKNNINFKLVNCYENDIVNQLEECKVLFWHHHQSNSKDILIAKQILFALEHTGFKVFPNFKTSWHFDDKVAQKYLFERIQAPLVKSYVFLDKKEALDWVYTTSFPKVFKLRGGAGSANVSLIKNKRKAVSIVKKGFGRGFNNYDAISNLKERWRKFRLGTVNFLELVKGFLRLFKAPSYTRIKGKEIGYLYFQDFIPNLDCDYRIIIIDSKTLAVKRFIRDNDFRASGSGKLAYDPDLFPIEMIKLANQVAKKLKFQSAAFDFVIHNGEIKLIEISYGFPSGNFVDDCPGYWDEKMNWHEGKFNPYGWMVDLMIK